MNQNKTGLRISHNVRDQYSHLHINASMNRQDSDIRRLLFTAIFDVSSCFSTTKKQLGETESNA